MSWIIAADDDTLIRQVYTHMLENLGHEFVVCRNGEEALAEFKKRTSDLMILDISMPDIDGLEVCRRIRKIPDGVGVPIIIVSGSGSEDSINKGFSAGATDYMLKPVQQAVFLAKLKNFLKTSSLNQHEFNLVHNHVVFSNRFRIEKVIGYGAHSVVFLAHDQQDKRDVALKVLNQNTADQEILAQYVETLKEYQLTDPEKFVKIIDFGQESGQVFVVMELAGDDLRHSINTGVMDEPHVCSIAIDILESLNELQSHDLLHLDIKPENIIHHNGRFKLTDFGMVTTRNTLTVPLKMEVWSTAAYACPESFDGTSGLDYSSDIYSLGIVLFELATGDNPFLSDKPTVAMYRHINLKPPYVSSLRKDFSFEFSCMIESMLEKSKDKRPKLQVLLEGFKAIRGYYENNNLKQLNFISEDDFQSKQKNVDLLNRTCLNLERMNIKPDSKLSVFDRVGELGVSLMSRKYSRTENSSWKKIAIIVLIVGVCFNILGYYSFASFKYNPVNQSNMPEIKVQCHHCGHIENCKTANIDECVCSKCGGKCGFSMRCNKCSATFPWNQPKIPIGTDIKTSAELIRQSMKCPACNSSNVSYVEPKGGNK
ncbi:MAG: response regulator [Victivallales bacterium]|nr:response regulator [Victivallales bacterium]